MIKLKTNIYYIMISNSQAGQDIFAYTLTNKKQKGYFLEIGANHPINCNNTYILEKDYNWKGLMIEYDNSFLELYNLHRPNAIYSMGDARNVNFRQIMDSNNFPENMDYLQIDLDVDNKSTLDTLILLDNTVFEKYKFATITFEHDIYTGNYFDTQSISRQIFENRGYVLIFPNVSVFWQGEYKQFEDWYVHPSLVDLDYVNAIKTNDSMTCDDIKKILLERT